MRRHHEIVVLDDQIADRRQGHVQPQRLPVVAVVERDVDGPLRAREQQPPPLRILADRVDRRAGNAADDLRPRLAAVVRAEDVRAQIVEAKRVDRGVGRRASNRPASMIETLLHGPIAGGVTSVHVTPAVPVVTWINPSSVPTQMRLMS